MNAFTAYFLKSALWLTGFAIVYFLFLRNERYFRLKRIYLLCGILFAFIFPLITFRYNVSIPSAAGNSEAVSQLMSGNIEKIANQASGAGFSYLHVIMLVYLAGILFISLRLIRQIRFLVRKIEAPGSGDPGKEMIIKVPGIRESFSFFGYVFINPSLNEAETRMIVNHELAHVSQKHWFDLILLEILKLFQWINPVAWIYSRFIRQNHEYLADEAALRLASDPAVYKAVMISQIFDSRIFDLSNTFNYSINKKRFDMMKKVVSSPYRKIKLLFVLPVIAMLFYAFAKPEFSYTPLTVQASDDQQTWKEAGGMVAGEDGKPFAGVTIVVTNSAIGTVTDKSGKFVLTRIPEGSSLIFSAKGFKTYMMPPLMTSNKNLYIRLARDPDFREEVALRRSDGTPANPLYVIDGNISLTNTVAANDIHRINVLKDAPATEKYGEQGKNGVIEITTKEKAAQQARDLPPEPFVIVEEMPLFPGGDEELLNFIETGIKYPEELRTDNIKGKVIVRFVVTNDGTVGRTSIIKGVHPLMDTEALRVVNSLPAFTPGKQGGKPVDVWYMVPVNFEPPVN